MGNFKNRLPAIQTQAFATSGRFLRTLHFSEPVPCVPCTYQSVHGLAYPAIALIPHAQRIGGLTKAVFDEFPPFVNIHTVELAISTQLNCQYLRRCTINIHAAELAISTPLNCQYLRS